VIGVKGMVVDIRCCFGDNNNDTKMMNILDNKRKSTHIIELSVCKSKENIATRTL
jgi:hypothetical protein